MSGVGAGVGAGLRRRTGVEIELLAPEGASRDDLAEVLAGRARGTTEAFWHVDGEPSLVPGIPFFRHLTRGLVVRDAAGRETCRLVDDITIRQDLDPRAPARPGVFRVVSDGSRLTDLVRALTDPDAPLADVLTPVADAFGVPVVHAGPAVKVDAPSGGTVAVAMPSPGGRERVCEIVTPPLDADHEAHLEALLGPARDLGFTVPTEAATHLHVDAAPLRTVHAFANLVRLFSSWRAQLHHELGTNPACRRLAPPPAAAVDLVRDAPPATWQELVAAGPGLGLVKYADVNLTALLAPRAVKDTVEVRCLPGTLDAAALVARAALVERLLDRCEDPRPVPRPRPGARLADLLGTA